MRTVSGGELTVLNGSTLNVYSRLEIKNASGTWKDYSTLASKDYFVGIRLSTDVDVPVWSMQASLKRDGEASTESLSPLRGDSTLNVDDAALPAPAINAAREWRVSVAVIAAGATLTGGDWKELCAGYLDKPDFSADPMAVEGRSVGARLMDQTIRVKRTYAGSLSDVAQQIVDDNVPAPTPTLYIPSPPAFTVEEFTPFQVSVMDALVTLALSTGWMVRDVYDPGDGVMKTAIIDPDRARTSDATLTPTTYLTVDQASLDVANIRNVIEGEYIDAVTGEVASITVSDPASIAAFGGVERYMKFSEDATSPIDTGNEMLAMVQAALADLSTPKFDHVVTSTLFWPAEIADLYDFTGNAVHYDTTQTLGLFGIVHDLTIPGHGTTQLTCRGTPAGAYLEWIRRQGPGPLGPLIPPAPVLLFLLGELSQFGGTVAEVDGALWLGYRMPKGVDEIRVHVLLGNGPELGVPNIDGTTIALTIRRPEGDIGSPPTGDTARFGLDQPGEYASLAMLSTRPQYWKRALFYGFRGGLTSVAVIPPVVQAVDPSSDPLDGTIASLDVDRAGTTNTVTVTPGTLETDISKNGNWLCIMRNEHVLPPYYIQSDTTPIVFEDTGLEPKFAAEAVYDAFIWNSGKSGPLFRGTTSSAPPPSAPQFANGTPITANVAGVAKVQIDWTATTPGAGAVRVEASLDGVNVRVVGQGSLASGTVYDPVTGPKLYRLVAIVVLTNTPVAYSDWKWFTGLPGPLSNPGSVPQFINATPKPVLIGSGFTNQLRLSVQWSCATPGGFTMHVQRSTTGAGGTYTDVPNGVSASVATGTWISPDATWATTDAHYRLRVYSGLAVLLATSAVVHYVPPT